MSMTDAFSSTAMSRRDELNLPGGTTYLERFVDALGLLCRKVPPQALCEAWLNHESEDLQEWVVNHLRKHWASGIGTIEAAQCMANVPAEGENHEGYLEDTERSRAQNMEVFHLFGVTPKRVGKLEVPAVQYHDFLIRAVSLEEACDRALEYAGVADMAELWGASREDDLALVSPGTRFHKEVRFEQHLNWARIQERYVLVHEGPESLNQWHGRPFEERAPGMETGKTDD